LSLFPDNFFDFAYSFTVFQHISDKEIIANYISEASAGLKPDRVFKFQVNGQVDPEYLNALKDPWIGESFSEEEVRYLHENAGFGVIRLTDAGTEFMWVPLRNIKKQQVKEESELSLEQSNIQ